MNQQEYMTAAAEEIRNREELPVGTTDAHRVYFAQFVDAGIKWMVEQFIGLDVLLASTDPSLNDIPLDRWDALAGFVGGRFHASAIPSSVIKRWREINATYRGGISASDMVCIYKEAAKQIQEEYAQGH